MKMVRFFALALVLVLSSAASAEVVHDDKLGVSFTVPAGFKDFPAAKAASTPYSYVHGDSGAPDYMIIAIEDMQGTIGRDHLTLADLPKDTAVAYELRHEMWKGYDIDVVVGHGSQGEGDITVLVAQVPLTPSAIRVKIMGATDHVVHLNPLMTSLLASIDGKRNWLTDSVRSMRLGFLVGVPSGPVIGVCLAIWLRKRRKAAARPA